VARAAAHCVESVGQGVRDFDGVQFGTVAFIGNADATATDYAFIKVEPEDVGRISATQEQRTAIMGFDDAETYDVSGPIHWGDSGGPLVHKRTGKALGIVSRLCAGACSEEGPTVQGILAKAAAAGYRVTLRTV
jgi:hypothetical protein